MEEPLSGLDVSCQPVYLLDCDSDMDLGNSGYVTFNYYEDDEETGRIARFPLPSHRDFSDRPNPQIPIPILPNEVTGPEQESSLEVTLSTWFQCPTCQVLLDSTLRFLEHKRAHLKKGRKVDQDLDREASELDQAAVPIVLPVVLLSRLEDVSTTVYFNDMNVGHVTPFASEASPDLTCVTCSQRMSSKDSLRRHMMRHTGEKPYGCHICDYRAIQKTHLKAHIFYNHGEHELKSISLSPLRKKLKQKELERFQNQRFPFGPYRCERCNVGFRKNDNLQRHNQKRHAEEQSEPVELKVTPIVIPSLNPNAPISASTSVIANNMPSSASYASLVDQLALIRSNLPISASLAAQQSNLPISATTGSRTFPSSSTALKVPSFPSVSQSVFFRCPVCTKLLSSEHRLDKHLQTHMGIRPFSCITCGKTFKQKFHLKRHMIRVHPHPSGPPSVTFDSHVPSSRDKCAHAMPCSVCGRVLSNVDTLRRHMLIHQGIKPFACETCGETFRQKHHVQVHARRHHGDEAELGSGMSKVKEEVTSSDELFGF